MESKDNLLGVLRTIFQKKKFLLRLCGIVLIGSAIISLVLPVYYKSTTVFYAASQDLSNPDRLFGGGNAADTRYYGTGEDIDRLITIAESSELVDFLVRKFNLYEHYGIDSTGAKARHRIQVHFHDLYKVVKTKYDAIEVSVEDKDKKMAADIANAARTKIEEIAIRLLKESQGQQIQAIDQNIKSSEALLNTLGDSLSRLRLAYGIVNADARGQALTNLYAEGQSKMFSLQGKLESYENNPYAKRDSITIVKANLRGAEEQVKKLSEEITRFNEGVSIIEVLGIQHSNARNQLSWDKERLKHLRGAYESNLPVIHLVESASLPLVKSRPIRSIIVAASVMIAVIFGIIGILIFDNYKEVDWRSIMNGESDESIKKKAREEAIY